MRELALHLLDLLENALEAGASVVRVEVSEDTQRDELSLRVVDDGRGIPGEDAEQAFDPFFTSRTTRHVGFGLPLLRAAAERAGGGVSLETRPGHTEVVARWAHSHIDRAPLGDVAGALVAFLLGERHPRLLYSHDVNGRSVAFDSAELEEALHPVPIGDPNAIVWLQSYISESIASLREGVAP